MKTVRIDVNESDEEFLKVFMGLVRQTVNVGSEMFGKEQQLLLSPYFREMYASLLKTSKEMLGKIGEMQLYVDNPATPLRER